MEIIVCLLLAALLGGGRIGADIVHAVKGTTPPHLEKARLKAQQSQQQKAPRERSAYADGKPRVKDVAAVYWGDAMASAIEAHDRRRAEKAGQQAENERAAAAGEQPTRVRPSAKARLKRLGRLLIDPVGERPTMTLDPRTSDDQERLNPVGQRAQTSVVHGADSPSARYPDSQSWSWTCRDCTDRGSGLPTHEAAATAAQAHDCRPNRTNSPAGPVCPGCGQPYRPRRQALMDLRCPECREKNVGGPSMFAFTCNYCHRQFGDYQTRAESLLGKQSHEEQCQARTPESATPSTEGDDMATTTAQQGNVPTGEAVNYETAMAELDKIEDAQRTHLDSTQAALERVQQAKSDISNSQATYRPAAEAASSTHQHLSALNLDAQTVTNTGTMADAMPPNRVDEMFEQLEAIEADVKQQLTNAESALASTQTARQVIVEKYGDAHATVQGELAGDSRFLAGSGLSGSYAGAPLAAQLNPTPQERENALIANPTTRV